MGELIAGGWRRLVRRWRIERRAADDEIVFRIFARNLGRVIAERRRPAEEAPRRAGQPCA